MEVVIFLAIILISLLIIDCAKCANRDEIPYSPFVVLISIIGTMIFILNSVIDPIEVYRGNTTLEITYRDSIPIDSIVVLKNRN